MATGCSGSDAPVKGIVEACATLGVECEHVMSIENEKEKRRFIRSNFPDLKHLYGDVQEVALFVPERDGMSALVPFGGV